MSIKKIEFSRLATEEEKDKFFKAIEDNGYQWDNENKTLYKLVERPMVQWLPIDCDDEGIATDECLDKIFNGTPCVVCFLSNGRKSYRMVGECFDNAPNREDIRTNTRYTHYLHIPEPI